MWYPLRDLWGVAIWLFLRSPDSQKLGQGILIRSGRLCLLVMSIINVSGELEHHANRRESRLLVENPLVLSYPS